MSPPPRYTDEQRQAITRAVLDAGCTVLEALRRAQAGALPDTPPFTMHKDAAYRAVKEARDERDQLNARNTPLDAIPDLARSLLAATVREGKRLERLARQGKYDADAIRHITRNTQELHKLLRYTDPTSPEQAGKGKQGPHEPAQPLNLAQLITPPSPPEHKPTPPDTSPARSDALTAGGADSPPTR